MPLISAPVNRFFAAWEAKQCADREVCEAAYALMRKTRNNEVSEAMGVLLDALETNNPRLALALEEVDDALSPYTAATATPMKETV